MTWAIRAQRLLDGSGSRVLQDAMKLRPPQEVRGFSLEELDLRGRYGVNVLAIRRPKQRFEYADSSTRINADDEIIVSGDSHLLEYFANRP